MIGPSVVEYPASELQSLVDGLGHRLRRAVELEDAHARLLAFNSQHGPLDEVRRSSILERKSPAACMRWAHRQGIREACAPLRLPRNPDLGMEPRICAPVRLRGRLFGHLWLIDPDEDLADSELAALQTTADTAAEILYAAKMLADGSRGQSRELVKRLLSDDPAARATAEQDLVDPNLLSPFSPLVALVVLPLRPGPVGTGRGWRVSVAAALREIACTLSPGHMLTAARAEDGVLLATPQDPALSGRTLRDLAESLHAAAVRHGGGQALIVGVGDVQPSLSAAHDSYRHARAAARIARAFPRFRPVASWDDLGAYQLVSQFPGHAPSLDTLHPGLARLARAPRGEILVETLERYLDLGCDAPRTAADLGLHRTSLYQRLDKIRDLAGVDIRDGEQRLGLHLGLKLARLAELLPDN